MRRTLSRRPGVALAMCRAAGDRFRDCGDYRIQLSEQSIAAEPARERH